MTALSKKKKKTRRRSYRFLIFISNDEYYNTYLQYIGAIEIFNPSISIYILYTYTYYIYIIRYTYLSTGYHICLHRYCILYYVNIKFVGIL